MNATQVRHWRRDPIAFVSDVLRDPDSDGRPFELYAEEEAFLREALTLTPGGSLPYSELLYSAPKKSGKTAIGAISMLYVIVALCGRYAEGYCLANDEEQAQGRVFQACGKIIECSPLLKDSAKITQSVIEFPATRSTITALASDYAGSAGSNANFTVFDELWAFTSERTRRLWDELTPPPTRRVTARLTVTYAGFTGESALLEDLLKRGLGTPDLNKEPEPPPSKLFIQPGMLTFHTHKPVAPWQTQEWLDNMRRTMRASAYLRMIENRFTSGESEFVDMLWWDACVQSDLRPVFSDLRLPVWFGVDASTKKDSTAIVGCTYDNESKRVRLVYHRVFQPTKDAPLDFEFAIEGTLLELRDRFRMREVRYDPWQMVSSAQRLKNAGLPMVEFPQSLPNLTEASQNLYDLIKGTGLLVYPDADIRLAISRAVAKESSRGWRIGKEKQTHKIDVVVALAQAALGAAKGGTQSISSFANDGLMVSRPIHPEFVPSRWPSQF